MAEEKAFEQKKTIRHRKEKPKLTGEVKYADAPFVDSKDGEKLEDVRKDYAKNGDKPTTASAKAKKDLPGTVKEVDGSGKAQVMPELYQNMNQIMSLLSMAGGMAAGLGGSGGGGAGTLVISGSSVILQDAFTGALALLVRRYGFEETILVFNTTLSMPGAYNSLDPMYRTIVYNSLANLIRLALYFGPLNIPTSYYDDTYFGDLVPTPVVAAAQVPNGYVKQYYALANDPYPGYEEWRSPTTSSKVYVRKAKDSYHFNNANEEIYSTTERSLAEKFYPYFAVSENNVTVIKIMTPQILNQILHDSLLTVENNLYVLNLGSGSNNSSNLAGMLGGLLSMLIQLLMTQMQEQDSAVQGSDLQQTMQKFQKEMGINNQILQIGKNMLSTGAGLGALGAMGGLDGILGGFTSGGLGGVMGGMFGGGGSFGGGSGGGGGGAGDGFAGYNGNYSGGGVSPDGLKDIEKLLTLLGIEQ